MDLRTMTRDDYLQPYHQAAADFGDDFKVTLWASQRTQVTRFQVFADMLDLQLLSAPEQIGRLDAWDLPGHSRRFDSHLVIGSQFRFIWTFHFAPSKSC